MPHSLSSISDGLLEPLRSSILLQSVWHDIWYSIPFSAIYVFLVIWQEFSTTINLCPNQWLSISLAVEGNSHIWQCSIACNESLRLPRLKDLICNRDDPICIPPEIGSWWWHIHFATPEGPNNVHGPWTPILHKRLSGSQPFWLSGRAMVGVAESPLMRSFTGLKPLIPRTVP